MKYWKLHYWIIIILIVGASSTIYLIYGCNGVLKTSDIVSGALASIALVISVISIAQSDRRKLRPKLKIQVWCKNNIQTRDTAVLLSRINFRIINENSKEPFEMSQLLITVPESSVYKEGTGVDTIHNGWNDTQYGNSTVLKMDFDYYSNFIGTNEDNTDLSFMLNFHLLHTKNRNIYVDIYSEKYAPIQLKINSELLHDLVNGKFTSGKNYVEL